MKPLDERGYSPYRLKDAREWVAAGWADFEVVANMADYPARVRTADVPEERRSEYRVLCRPASGGRYGKSVLYRAVPAVTVRKEVRS